MKADEKEGKRQRQSQSCDACRVRKVKCEPVSGDDGQVPAAVSTGEPSLPLIDAADKKPTNQGSAGRRAPCKQCIQLGSDCTYEYVPRKRGPPNLYLRKLSEAKQAGMQFPSEADFEAAKASSRAVAERKKARGKGSAGHELEHVSEYAMKEEHDMDWRLTRSLEGKTEDVKSTGRLPGNPIPHNYEQDRRVSSETSNGTAESYVRTAMTGDGNAIAGGTSNFSTAAPSGTIHTTTAVQLTDDAFTPSQFLDLQAELDYTATSAIGNPSPIAFKHHLPSGGDSYPSGLSNLRAFDSHTKTSYHRETAVQHSSKPLAMVDGAHANSHRLHAPSANRSILAENTHNPIISPLGFEQAGAYFTSPSDAGSSIGIANSHFVHRPPVADLPDRLVSTPSRRLSLDLALPEGVRNDFILDRTRTYSTTTVHRDSSASGADNQLCLPTHPSNSQTIGEVGSTYLYNRAPAAIDQRRQSGTELHSQPPLTGSFTGQTDVPGIEHGPASLYNNHGQPSLQPVNPLEAIIPRPLLQHIINLFFDYVYPLTPCLHKPTFLADLARHREMEPGQGEWTVLVLAVIMSTLVQVPRAFVPLTRREVKDLAYRCHIAGRKWSLHGYKDFTVNAVIIRYFDAVYNYCRGEIATCHTSLCESQALATVLRLHEEETYTYLSSYQCEEFSPCCRLMADKSESVLSGRPIRMREEECHSLRLPEELWVARSLRGEGKVQLTGATYRDDEYITETRYLQQPKGTTSVITGFNASIRIHCLGGRAITKHKEDKRDPPTGVRLQRRLEEVAMLLDEVTDLMRDCPPQLRLKQGLDSRMQSPAGGWDVEAAAKIQAFFFDPQASREFARNAFLVQQGNILVTQQCVRFVLLQYQNDLLHLKAAAEAATIGSHAHGGAGRARGGGFIPIGGLPLGGISTSSAKKPDTDKEETDDYVAASKESLYYDLLSILHSIPIQCIAVNGPSLVNCVRYVASGLLDTVQFKPPSATEDQQGEGEASNVARAQGYLIDFLSILSDIEKNYSLDDDAG